MKISNLKIGDQIKYKDIVHDTEICASITNFYNETHWGLKTKYFDMLKYWSINPKFIVSTYDKNLNEIKIEDGFGTFLA